MTRMPWQDFPLIQDDRNLVSVGGCLETPVGDCNGFDPTFTSAGACLTGGDPVDICQNLHLKAYAFKFHDVQPNEAVLDSLNKSGKGALCPTNLALGAKSPGCCRPVRQASATSAYSCFVHDDLQ